MKPITKISLAAILLASVFVVGCGSSSCDKNLLSGPRAPAPPRVLAPARVPALVRGPAPVPALQIIIPVLLRSAATLSVSPVPAWYFQDNGGNSLTLSQNGAFVFTTPIALGSAYAVTVATQPSGQTLPCSVTSGAGTATANVTNVQITCGNTYSVGGVVSGLQGSGLVLQDNGGNNLTVSGTGNPSFTFPVPLPAGSTYAVTIIFNSTERPGSDLLSRKRFRNTDQQYQYSSDCLPRGRVHGWRFYRGPGRRGRRYRGVAEQRGRQLVRYRQQYQFYLPYLGDCRRRL